VTNASDVHHQLGLGSYFYFLTWKKKMLGISSFIEQA
jgi:hypothetical protein